MLAGQLGIYHKLYKSLAAIHRLCKALEQAKDQGTLPSIHWMIQGSSGSDTNSKHIQLAEWKCQIYRCPL